MFLTSNPELLQGRRRKQETKEVRTSMLSPAPHISRTERGGGGGYVERPKTQRVGSARAHAAAKSPIGAHVAQFQAWLWSRSALMISTAAACSHRAGGPQIDNFVSYKRAIVAKGVTVLYMYISGRCPEPCL